jgi:hypothetical protein
MEALASEIHEIWASWQGYVHACSFVDPVTGTALIIPTEKRYRWERQIATPYDNLSDREQESDREQVRRLWPLIVEYFANGELAPRVTF